MRAEGRLTSFDTVAKPADEARGQVLGAGAQHGVASLKRRLQPRRREGRHAERTREDDGHGYTELVAGVEGIRGEKVSHDHVGRIDGRGGVVLYQGVVQRRFRLSARTGEEGRHGL